MRILAPCRARPIPVRRACSICRSGHFGKQGLQGGGQGGEDLAKLIGQQGGGGGLDLGSGIDLSQGKSEEDDPLNYDPEGLFKGATTLQDGHIDRRMSFRGLESQEEMDEAMARQKAAQAEAMEERRAAAVVPEDPAALVDFFLNTDAADMEYFVAKARARLGPAFFAAIDTAVGQEKFLDDPNEETLAELQGLREYVTQLLKAQDSVKQGVLSATDRLKKVLTAKDKKQTILDMAAANEIDAALIQLLQQNIDGATAAGQEDAAAFMAKVRDACAKYVITIKKGMSEEEKVKAALKGELGGVAGADGDAKTAGGVILPGSG